MRVHSAVLAPLRQCRRDNCISSFQEKQHNCYTDGGSRGGLEGVSDPKLTDPVVTWRLVQVIKAGESADENSRVCHVVLKTKNAGCKPPSQTWILSCQLFDELKSGHLHRLISYQSFSGESIFEDNVPQTCALPYGPGWSAKPARPSSTRPTIQHMPILKYLLRSVLNQAIAYVL